MNEMHTESSNTGAKAIATKILAIVGFCATLAFIVWLIAGLVSNAPERFASLASIIDSLERRGSIPELTIATENIVVNSKEPFTITWTDMKKEGEYNFSYACADGVALAIVANDGKFTGLKCGEATTFPTSVHEITLGIKSDKARFTDVPLSLSFSDTDGNVLVTSELKMTVVNASVPTSGETPKEDTASSTVSNNTGGARTGTTNPRPTYTPPRIVYPTSDPNGRTDLMVTTVGVGKMSGGTFIPVSEFDVDTRAGVKIDVKNIGTRTSDTWTLTVKLPNGETYKSETQSGLKPQEHVTFTIGFELDEDTGNTVKITSTVRTDRDANDDNDSTVRSVDVND